MDRSDDDSFIEYRRSVREKAAGTIHELRHVLDRDPVISPEERRMQHPAKSESKDTFTCTEHSDYSYSAAVNRLRDMLDKVSPSTPAAPASKSILFKPPPRVYSKESESTHHELLHDPYRIKSGQTISATTIFSASTDDIPNPEETVRILQNEAARIQHLETEKRFLSEELHHLKKTVMEIIEENRVLHEELRRSMVHELMNEGVTVPGIPLGRSEPVRVLPSEVPSSSKLSRVDYEKWHSELEKINSLHVAKTARLETQLQYAKDELQKYEAEANELRKQVRLVESWKTVVDPSIAGSICGLCIKCASNESVLPPSVSLLQKQSIDSLTRERDDLVAHLTLFKTRYEETRHREEDLYQQVKASTEMVEQSQLEMTQAMIEREQMREELANAKLRLEEQIQLMSLKIAEECDVVRKEGKSSRDELNNKIKELLEKLAETQILLDKTTREKMSTLAELEIVRGQLSTNDMDYSKATENIKINLTQASLDRNLALQQVERIKQEMNQAESDRHAERLRLKQEVEDLRRRLHQAEKELLASKEECIALHNANQTLEREVHLTKLSKESLQRGLTDDLSAAEKRAEQREVELNEMVDSLQRKHAKTNGELEEYNKSQNLIIQKLREECRLLVKKLEEFTHKYKGENHKLKQHNEQASQKLERTLLRCRELQEQHSQQGILQEKMRERLQLVDRQAQHASQQITELLAKESILMRERRELCRHVEFLQRELMTCGDEDKVSVYLGSRGLVDGILKNVKNEEIRDKNRELSEDAIQQEEIISRGHAETA